MSFNFSLTGMTHLKYFVPIIVEANRRKIKSNVFVGKCNKYCCPHRNMQTLKDISKKYNFDLLDINNINMHPATTFLIEGDGLEYINYSNKKYAITYMTDFAVSLKSYIARVDHVIFPNEYFAKYYKVENKKNLYFGSPKYSLVYDSKKEILEKYNITNKTQKNALIIFPKLRDLNKIDLLKLYSVLKSLGFNLIIKSRGKDPIPNHLKGDYSFLDASWHPHTTLELLKISDIAINFSSTAIKECIMLNVPIINFHIKPFVKPLEFLYNFNYCKQLNTEYRKEDISKALDYFFKTDLKLEFEKCRNLYLFENKKVVGNIIDHALQ
tara:strand:- start:1582 stop:2556 length:975 start_codon:yes stop_codon:yes gene_type:complete